jgi:hypothetical protein
MSEPLFVATLLTFLVLDRYFQSQAETQKKGQGRVRLIAAGCVIGLAHLTRYAALALLATTPSRP